MEAFISLFSQYNVPAAFLVNIELTLWSALFSTILGVILVMMRISPVASLRIVSGAYVELFKNLPLTIIMVFMVLGAYLYSGLKKKKNRNFLEDSFSCRKAP